MEKKFKFPNSHDYDSWPTKEPDPEEEKDKLWEKLVKKVGQAKIEARNLSEADEADQQEAKLLNDFIQGKINLEQYHLQERNGLAPGEVEIPDQDMMLTLISTLLDGDNTSALDLMQHEMEHLQEATALGFQDSKLIIRFFKEGDQLNFRPAIQLSLPQKGDEKLIRQNLKKIIEAPAEMSDIDLLQVKK